MTPNIEGSASKEYLVNLLQLLDEQEQAYEEGKISLYKPHNGKWEGKVAPEGVYDGQQAFHRSKAIVRIAVTGNRYGKTTMSFIELAWLCTGTHPFFPFPVPVRAKVYVESYPMFMETWAQKIHEWLPMKFLAKKRPLLYNNQQQIIGINFANGSYIRVGTYDQQDKKSEGSNWHFVVFDEPPPRELYIANFRAIVDFGGRIWITATPLSEAWMFDDIWEPGRTGKKPYIECFDGTMEDNPHINKTHLKLFYDEMTPEEREVRYYGKFKKLRGLVINTYDPEINDVEPFQLDSHYCLYEGIDPHPSKPHAVLWKAIHMDGTRYVVRELLLDGSMEELAEAIHKTRQEFREQGCELVCSVADTSLNQKEAGYRSNLWVELKRHLHTWGETLMPSMAAKKDWLHAGITKLKDLYRDVLRLDGHRKPQQFVFKDCTHYKYELKHYQWPNVEELADNANPKPKYNDLIDCDRYIESKAPKYQTPGSGLLRTNKQAYSRLGRGDHL